MPGDLGDEDADRSSQEPRPLRRQRVGAYGIARDHEGKVLLVRAAPYLTVAGRWFLPGGGVEHGETPLDSLRREVEEEAGLLIADASLLGVLSDTWPIPDGGLLHSVRLIYRIDTWTGELRDETGGSSDRSAWIGTEELAGTPLVRYAREALVAYGSALGVQAGGSEGGAAGGTGDASGAGGRERRERGA
ncbi:MAG: NUDIX hydrolase [Acidimicrobiales bacterium]